jgi:hypothetical protein
VKVQYEEIGDPEETGVYAVRVDHPKIVNLVVDAFLMWYEGHWYYLGSDQQHRGEVHGWVGPLPRIRPLRNNVELP